MIRPDDLICAGSLIAVAVSHPLLYRRFRRDAEASVELAVLCLSGPEVCSRAVAVLGGLGARGAW